MSAPLPSLSSSPLSSSAPTTNTAEPPNFSPKPLGSSDSKTPLSRRTTNLQTKSWSPPTASAIHDTARVEELLSHDAESLISAHYKVKSIAGEPVSLAVATMLDGMGLSYETEFGDFSDICEGDYVPIMEMAPGAPAPFLVVTPSTAALNGRSIGDKSPVIAPFTLGGIVSITVFLHAVRSSPSYPLSMNKLNLGGSILSSSDDPSKVAVALGMVERCSELMQVMSLVASGKVKPTFYATQLIPFFMGGCGRHTHKSQGDTQESAESMDGFIVEKIKFYERLLASASSASSPSPSPPSAPPQPYLQGDLITAPDILLFWMMALRYRYGGTLTESPNLEAWYKSIAKLPTVHKNWPSHWNAVDKTSQASHGRRMSEHRDKLLEGKHFDTPLQETIKVLTQIKIHAASGEVKLGIERCLALLSDAEKVNEVDVDHLIETMEAQQKGGRRGSSDSSDLGLSYLKNHADRHRRGSSSPGGAGNTYREAQSSNRSSLIMESGDVLIQFPQGIGKEWNFDVSTLKDGDTTNLSKTPLFAVMQAITFKNKFPAAKTATILKFVSEIEKRYDSTNAYHNSFHAAEAAHAAWVLLSCVQKEKKSLTQADMFLGLIGAAIHDVGHRGVSNNFLIKNQDDLAITYNDIHVLENHHLAETFRIIAHEEGCNIFELCDQGTHDEFRKTIIEMVLATDLADHFSQVSSLRNKHSSKNLVAKDILIGIAMCADIGHSTKAFAIHERWSTLIGEEFYRQGEREEELGRPVSAMCDKSEARHVYFNSQVGFLQFLAEPLFETMREVVGSKGDECCTSLALNMQTWKDKRDEAKTNATAVANSNSSD